MKKTSLLFVFILLFLNVLYAQEYKMICFSQLCLNVELAQSNSEREKGLMLRKQLNDDEGMLFIFEQDGVYGFWMKNMLISLDILWLDKNMEIVDISERVKPCLDECVPFYPQKEVRYVLEVREGFVEKNNIKRGQILKFGDK